MLPARSRGGEVGEVRDVCDLATTWPAARADDSAAQQLDTQKLHRDFGTIRAAVSEALARRMVWGALGTLVVYVSVCSVIAAFVTVVVSSS